MALRDYVVGINQLTKLFRLIFRIRMLASGGSPRQLGYPAGFAILIEFSMRKQMLQGFGLSLLVPRLSVRSRWRRHGLNAIGYRLRVGLFAPRLLDITIHMFISHFWRGSR